MIVLRVQYLSRWSNKLVPITWGGNRTTRWPPWARTPSRVCPLTRANAVAPPGQGKSRNTRPCVYIPARTIRSTTVTNSPHNKYYNNGSSTTPIQNVRQSKCNFILLLQCSACTRGLSDKIIRLKNNNIEYQ